MPFAATLQLGTTSFKLTNVRLYSLTTLNQLKLFSLFNRG